MTIFAKNDASDINNNYYIEAVDENIGERSFTLTQVLTIPARALTQYHIIRGWTSLASKGFLVTPIGVAPAIPPGARARVLSAIGTVNDAIDLMRQEQYDKKVVFAGDYNFDTDMGVAKEGNGEWFYRGNYGGWPTGYVRAVLLRVEVGRRASASAGMGQINLAARCTPGSVFPPSNPMLTQTKGPCVVPGNLEHSEDQKEVSIDPALDSIACSINTVSLGAYLNSGFILS